MMENDLTGLDGVHTALSWVVPASNSSTFVNGYTPAQLALGREPALPGRLSDERTSPLQLQLTGGRDASQAAADEVRRPCRAHVARPRSMSS